MVDKIVLLIHSDSWRVVSSVLRWCCCVAIDAYSEDKRLQSQGVVILMWEFS